MSKTYRRRAMAALAALGLAGTLGACDDMLSVQNPAAVGEESLADPTMTPNLANSVVGEFQRMYTDIAYYGAILTDEAVTGHNFFQIKEFDLRIMDETNSQLPNIYSPIQRARVLGEDIVGRLRTALGDDAAADLGFARALAYTGYASILLGEYYCEAPVSPTDPRPGSSSEEILRRALPYFDEAIAVATAAKIADSTVAAEADPIINLARVGAARASLQVGDNAEAIAYAQPVPASFVAWIRHATAKSFLENPFESATTGTNHNLGVDVTFRGLNDPRVRHRTKGRTGHNQLTDLFTPYQPSSFSEWTAADSVGFGEDTDVRFASGLEARYIVAEAGGLTAGELRAFINERRAVGNQGLFLGLDSELQAELREQRRRDFFLDGHRLGDLRRYSAEDGVDRFPTGAHPNEEWGNYGTAECFIPHYSEWIGHPRN